VRRADGAAPDRRVGLHSIQDAGHSAAIEYKQFLWLPPSFPALRDHPRYEGDMSEPNYPIGVTSTALASFFGAVMASLHVSLR